MRPNQAPRGWFGHIPCKRPRGSALSRGDGRQTVALSAFCRLTDLAGMGHVEVGRPSGGGPVGDCGLAPVHRGACTCRALRPPRIRPRQWRDILADGLARQEAIRVRGTVIDHLRRTLTLRIVACPLPARPWAARRAALISDRMGEFTATLRRVAVQVRQQFFDAFYAGQASRRVLRVEDGDADIPDLLSPPPMNRGSGYMSRVVSRVQQDLTGDRRERRSSPPQVASESKPFRSRGQRPSVRRRDAAWHRHPLLRPSSPAW
jgi:hypothetical protein